MKKIFTNASQIVTAKTGGKNYKQGNELSELEVIENHSIFCENGIIKDIIPNYAVNKFVADEFDPPDGDQLYVYGPLPPETVTEAEPPA